MNTLLRPALSLLVLLTLITGVLYPFAVTTISQTIFAEQAAGSLIRNNETIVGSKLIGQNFSAPQYFWGRLSATSPYPYNAAASSGSNLGPLNSVLTDNVKARIDALHAADPHSVSDKHSNAPIPVDLVTASASGLDPHISPAAANYQIARVAQARHLDRTTVEKLVAENTEGRQWGVLGERRVNVLELNMALDRLGK
jgi:K+-transporting ATPase ATPase C chain